MMKRNLTSWMTWLLAVLLGALPLLAGAEMAGRSAYSNEIQLEVLPGDSPIGEDEDAQFALDITGDRAFAAAGEEVHYTVSLRNVSEKDASARTVEIYLPDGLSSTAAEDGKIRWIVTMEAGASSAYTFSATPDAGAAGTLSVTAVLGALAAQTQLTIASAELAIDLSAPTHEAAPGDSVTFTLVAENRGDAAGEWAILATAPSKATMSGYSQTVEVTGDSFLWKVALAAGEKASITFQATLPADASGTWEFSAQDRDAAEIADYWAIHVGAAQLSIEKTVDDENPYAGDLLTWKMIVVNTSDADAKNVIVQDRLPAGTHAHKIGADGKIGDDRVIEWRFDLAAGETKTLTVSAFVDDNAKSGTVIRNTARVYDADGTLYDADSVESKVLADPEPVLTIRKTVSNRTPEPGDRIRYTITVRNDGGADAEDVRVLDELPWELSIDEDSINRGGVYDWENDRIRWTVDVPAGDSVRLTFRARIPEEAEDGDYYRNYAKIVGGDSARATCYVTDGVVPKTGDPMN